MLLKYHKTALITLITLATFSFPAHSTTLKFKQRFTIPGEVISFKGDTVLIGSGDHSIYSLNVTNGNLIERQLTNPYNYDDFWYDYDHQFTPWAFTLKNDIIIASNNYSWLEDYGLGGYDRSSQTIDIYNLSNGFHLQTLSRFSSSSCVSFAPVGFCNYSEFVSERATAFAEHNNTILIASNYSWDICSCYSCCFEAGIIMEAYTFSSEDQQYHYKSSIVIDSPDRSSYVTAADLNEDKALIGLKTRSTVGVVYLFDLATGTQLDQLRAFDGFIGNNFGTNVALSENLALIGASGDDDQGKNSGSAYLFNLTTGNLLHKFIAPDGAMNDQFGSSLALSGDMALIGASGDDDQGENSGSAYLFDINTGELLQKLTVPNEDKEQKFGDKVILNDQGATISAKDSVYQFIFASQSPTESVPESCNPLILFLIGGIGILLQRNLS